MARIPPLAFALPLLILGILGVAASGPARPEPLPADADLRPRPGGVGSAPWLDEVRAQRRMLQELRRAQQEARKDQFMRRRQEIIEFMDTERWLFRNRGPWLEPFLPAPEPRHGPGSANSAPGAPNDELRSQPYPPPGWDNRWYFNGW